MADLAKFDTTKKSEAGAVLNLHDPLGAPIIDEESSKPVSITLLGPDSKRYTQKSREAQNRRLKKRMRSSRGTITAEEIDGDNLELLVSCTVAWHGIVVDGERLECNEANIRRLYTRFRSIRDQAQEFIDEAANFLGE